MSYTYAYPRPALAVDCVIFGWDGDSALHVLLIQRKQDPYQDFWALPGGFVEDQEHPDDAARRELLEETGVEQLWMEQFYTFGTPGRDPRGWVVSIGYMALVRMDQLTVQAADDASDASWFPINALPSLAFDHEEMLRIALQKLQFLAVHKPIGRLVMPSHFHFDRLAGLYEAILEKKTDDNALLQQLLRFKLLRPVEESTGQKGNKSGIFMFDSVEYQALTAQGFFLELNHPESV